ncbi:MAG: amidohydrolase family protein [Burkholderiaceae bacterium]|nr:amidohydrolase family protein [Burkholderiaceae bacterium]
MSRRHQTSAVELPGARSGAPAGACDCHMHVYDSRYPRDPSAPLRPPDAPVEEYIALQQRLRLSRVVVVQPSTYGFDNRCTLDALLQFGESARAIIVADAAIADEELVRLNELGVRGVRFNRALATGASLDDLTRLAPRLATIGWHAQINVRAHQLIEHVELFRRLPCNIVIDHLGHVPQPEGLSHLAFAALRGLIDRGQCFVKLSGVYLESKIGGPSYEDVGAVGRALLRDAPERLLWGSDWPHPTETVKPDAVVLLQLLREWSSDGETIHRVLVDNPTELYRFPAVTTEYEKRIAL